VIVVLAHQKMEMLLKLSKWHKQKSRECSTILPILLFCSTSTVVVKHVKSCGGRTEQEI